MTAPDLLVRLSDGGRWADVDVGHGSGDPPYSHSIVPGGLCVRSWKTP